MPKIEARLPKGMRDFLPEEVIKREYVFGVITDVFQTFGFEPIQTPVLEMRETLMGKYGEEAEKLIFQAQHPYGKEELALRYDLTVPLTPLRGDARKRPGDAIPPLPHRPGVAGRASAEGPLPRVLPVRRGHRRDREHGRRRRDRQRGDDRRCAAWVSPISRSRSTTAKF